MEREDESYPPVLSWMELRASFIPERPQLGGAYFPHLVWKQSLQSEVKWKSLKITTNKLKPNWNAVRMHLYPRKSVMILAQYLQRLSSKFSVAKRWGIQWLVLAMPLSSTEARRFFFSERTSKRKRKRHLPAVPLFDHSRATLSCFINLSKSSATGVRKEKFPSHSVSIRKAWVFSSASLSWAPVSPMKKTGAGGRGLKVRVWKKVSAVDGKKEKKSRSHGGMGMLLTGRGWSSVRDRWRCSSKPCIMSTEWARVMLRIEEPLRR